MAKELRVKVKWDDKEVVQGSKKTAKAVSEVKKETKDTGKEAKLTDSSINALAKTIGQLGLKVDKLATKQKKASKSIKETGKEASKTKEVMSKLGAAMVGVFGVGLITKTVSSMIALNKELFQTGQAALGIQKAFKAVDGSSLDDLRQVTKGTISDFKLMQSSVKGTKLGIDIAKMPALLNFARQSAKDMGEDVEVLAEKISVAIGRKSMLILDDFGITAMQLKKELGGLSAESASVAQLTDAVLKIAEKTMSTTGAGAADAADAYNQLVATMENAKLEGGLLLLNNESLQENLVELVGVINNNKEPILKFIADWGVGAIKIATAVGDTLGKYTRFVNYVAENPVQNILKNIFTPFDAIDDYKKHLEDQKKTAVELQQEVVDEAKKAWRDFEKERDERTLKNDILAETNMVLNKKTIEDKLKAESELLYKKMIEAKVSLDLIKKEDAAKKKAQQEEIERLKRINALKGVDDTTGVAKAKDPTSDAMTASELAGVSPYLAEKQERDSAIADITNKQKSLLEQKEADRVAVLIAMYSNIETERKAAQEKAIAEGKLRDFEKQKIKEQRDQTIKLATSAINSVTAIVGIMANESLNAFGKFSSVIGQGGSVLSSIPGYELVGSLVTAGAGLATSLFGQSDSDNNSSTASSALANRPLSNIQKEGSKTINNYFSVGFNSTYMGSSQNDLREFAGIVSDEINDLALSAG